MTTLGGGGGRRGVRGVGGRPPKFDTPSRRVTVTLPEATLEQIASFDSDRSRAIVRATNVAVGKGRADVPVDVVSISPGAGIIIVGASRYLSKIPGVRLMPIAPGRHLLSLAPGMQVDSLEVALGDLIETIPPGERRDARIARMLLEVVRGLRRHRRVSKEEILVVEMRGESY